MVKRIMRMFASHPFGVLWLLAAVLFGIGYHNHFGAIVSHHTVIYGDAGDGLFNLWILEHVNQHLGHELSRLADGRIFWPAHPYTYWWSDNLLVPSMVYGSVKWLIREPFLAYRITVYLLSLATYAAFIWLFVELWCGSKVCDSQEGGRPTWMVWLIPLFVYLAFFSQIRLHDYLHFQHLASVFLVTLIIGALRHCADLKRRDWLLMLISEMLLIYSAPYYAVLGLCILLGRIFFLLADRRIDLWSWGWRNALTALPIVLLCIPIVWMYAHGGEPLDYTEDVIRSMSLEKEHLYTPLGGWLRPIIASLLPDGLPAVRKGGYPGMGLILATLVTTVLVPIVKRHRIREGLRSHAIKVFLVLWCLTLVGDRDFMFYAWCLRLILIPLGLALAIAGWRQVEHAPQGHQLGMLMAALLTIYGTAFGPLTHFKPPYTDVSIWSFFAWLIPGYLNMREVLRFSSLGQLLLLAVLWHILLRAWQAIPNRYGKLMIGIITISCIGLQFSETIGMQVKQTRIEPTKVDLQDDEKAFFSDLQGTMLAIPSVPFHHNTYHQLRWQPYASIWLLNGYSARSTDTFDKLMALETQYGRASAQQVAFARTVGADYLCLLRGRIPEPVQQNLQQRFVTRFINQRFLVLALDKPMQERN